MPSEPYVFVSYARDDSVVVDRIVEALEKGGIRTWRDTTEIQPGTKWAVALDEAVKKASAYVYVASTHSRHSAWMDMELQESLSRELDGMLIVPAILDDAGENALPSFLRGFQWVDFRSDFDAGLVALIGALGGRVRPTTSESPKPKSVKGYAFISYAVEDRDFLSSLKEFLAEHEYGYWDFHENKRDYELQFHLELEGIIRNAEAVLCILSPEWKQSKWTPREFLFAEEIRKPIFLLRAKTLEPTLLIAGSSYIDFVEGADSGYLELDRELKRKGL